MEAAVVSYPYISWDISRYFHLKHSGKHISQKYIMYINSLCAKSIVCIVSRTRMNDHLL
jgi:hypothetical protein